MDKLLVITGGSRGIGLAAIELFAEKGYRVINLSRSSTNTDLASQINVDLSNSNWLSNIHQDFIKAVGVPDQITLVHNAALLLKDSSKKVEDFTKVLQINVIAAQQLNEVLIPLMKTGSSILYVGSTLSTKAVANTLTYSTSKHAVLGLMRASCQDLVGTGIHTACVCPGFTDTEMLREHIGQDKEVMKILAEANAYGRLVKPTEIADCLKFCAETAAINGTILNAHLGQIEH